MNIDPVSSITQEDSPQLPELRRHDFERPDYERPRALAKNLELPLKLWLSSASGLFNENWQPLTSQQVCLAHHAATVESFLSFKDNCPDHCWSIHARIGKPEFETAFVMDRRLVLAIVASLINESAETDPEKDGVSYQAGRRTKIFVGNALTPLVVVVLFAVWFNGFTKSVLFCNSCCDHSIRLDPVRS